MKGAAVRGCIAVFEGDDEMGYVLQAAAPGRIRSLRTRAR